jgi:hypothetical protein
VVEKGKQLIMASDIKMEFKNYKYRIGEKSSYSQTIRSQNQFKFTQHSTAQHSTAQHSTQYNVK